jgi:repressor LexA
MSSESLHSRKNPIGELMRDLRKSSGKTQQWLGEALGVSRQTINAWESGSAEPSAENLGRLEEVMKSLEGEFTGKLQKHKFNFLTFNRASPTPAVILLPLVTVPGRRRFTEMVTERTHYDELPKMGVLPLEQEGLTDCICVAVDGDSMEPQLTNGMVVLASEVKKEHWDLLNGGVYVVCYADFLVVKRVKDNTLNDGILQLHSDDPAGGQLTVPVALLRGVWRVNRIVHAPVR